MSNDYQSKLELQKEKIQREEVPDLRKAFLIMTSYWYYFLIVLIVSLLCAILYNTYTISTYRVTATLLINEENKVASVGNDQLLQGFKLGEGSKNLDNQIMVLSSRTLIERTLDELPFEIEYYQRGLFNKVALYPYHPIKIIPEIADSLPREIEFRFKYLGNTTFSLDAKSKDTFQLHSKVSFGKNIKFYGRNFRIESESDKWPSGKKVRNIYFICHDRDKLVENYINRLKINPVSKLGTIIRITLEGTNKAMDIAFLNKLTEIFLNNSLSKKNQEAVRTIKFIDDQLIGISDSLVITENKLQEFRSKNRVMNLSSQGQIIIDQAMKLENEKARIEIEDNYYNYLAEYLLKDNIGEVPIAPATIGITDPGLTKLVTDLADLQGQLYSKTLGEKNPLQSQLAQRVRNTKEALKEILNGLRRANNLARDENLAQIHTINAQATALPVTERQLLGIERKFKLNDELYTFLLEKRAVAQIQKASNLPDNETIDPAKSDILPLKPNKQLIYLFAIIAGIGLPFLWIFIANAFNNKVIVDEDIRKITDIPVTGHIPHSLLNKNLVVLDESGSLIAEAFRSLRSRMQFLTKATKTPVILITSSMPEEGKTFIAINLASVYSLMGKKTIIIDFDLRKPKVNTDFGLNNDRGVSTWLIGKDELQDIIKDTPYENLSVIPGGQVPPNPSELIALDKTEELIKLLKERYECIILNSAPIGTVSDTFHLSTLVDTTVFVVRQNMTLKDLFANTLKELKFSNIKNISVVINDLGPEYKRYGYGAKPGYNYSKVKSKN